MQRGNLMELNFDDLEMQKWNKPTDRVQILDLLNRQYYCCNYGHQNVKIGSIFVFSADDSKELVTV